MRENKPSDPLVFCIIYEVIVTSVKNLKGCNPQFDLIFEYAYLPENALQMYHQIDFVLLFKKGVGL